MIVQRRYFNIKPGCYQAAEEMWEESFAAMAAMKEQKKRHLRIMGALSGRTETLWHEIHLDNFNDINPMLYFWSINSRVQELYKQFIDICEFGGRDLYKIEYETGN